MTTSVPESRSPQDAPGFDADALRARYREERDKRLRDDGNAQYVEVKGHFAHYLDDPYAEPGFTRAPLADTVEVVVIGGGFGGLLAGARLRQAGVADIRIIDPAQDFDRRRHHFGADAIATEHGDVERVVCGHGVFQ